MWIPSNVFCYQRYYYYLIFLKSVEILYCPQFDPNNMSAPPILLNGASAPGIPLGSLQPQLATPISSAPSGILQMMSGNHVIGSASFQLGGSVAGSNGVVSGNGGVVAGMSIAGSMSGTVATTLTTAAVSACISSPAISSGRKVSLPVCHVCQHLFKIFLSESFTQFIEIVFFSYG